MGFFRHVKSLLSKKKILEFKEIEEIPDCIELFQVETGIIFFHNRNTHQIYVKWRGNAIDVELPFPEGSYVRTDVHGNAVYFFHDRKFYKVAFNPTKGIEVCFLRCQLEDEDVILGDFDRRVFCSRKRDGQTCLYRMCDDPNTDGVMVDVEADVLSSKDPIGIIRIHEFPSYERIIYTDDHYWPTATRLSENAVCLALSMQHDEITLTTFAGYSSHLFYTADFTNLTVMNAKTLEILPTLYPPDNLGIAIAGVHKNILTVIGTKFEDDDETTKYVMTTQLPERYYYPPNDDGESGFAIIEKQFGEQILLPEFEFEGAFTSEFREKFKTISVLGQGGFGSVFEVKNRLDKWTYAVKRIPMRGRKDEKKRTWEEVRVMASFDHPGIVRYNNSWQEDPPEGWQRYSDNKLSQVLNYKGQFNYKDDCSFLYIQMELCKYTLADWLKSNEDRESSKMKKWFKQIVAGVAYIHEQQRIHRDLKPSNILFAGEDRLKICDLGITADVAIIEGQEVPAERTCGKGTIMYMAPEQKWWDYTSKVDVFALGLILTEMYVVMGSLEAQEVFEIFRSGGTTDKLNHLPQVEELVAWLVSKNDVDRPDCNQILNHAFLAEIN